MTHTWNFGLTENAPPPGADPMAHNVPDPGETLLPALPNGVLELESRAGHLERIRTAALEAYAPSTRRAYEGAMMSAQQAWNSAS